MIYIISLLIVIIMSILITRIAASALVQTGLAKDTSRFQARSAFTGVGFTTNESEQVVNHPVRRKILMIVIFLGNVGLISAVSSLILSFISMDRTGYLSIEIIVLISGLLILLILAQSNWIDAKLSILINKALKRYTRLDVKDYYSLLHLSDDYRVSRIKAEQHHWLSNIKLSELKLRSEGILVLGIDREDGDYIGAPHGETQIYTGDTVLLYGRSDLLDSLYKRLKGEKGDQEHEDAVLQQDRILADQKDAKSELT